jgi:hypothetical protein
LRFQDLALTGFHDGCKIVASPLQAAFFKFVRIRE